MTPAFPGLAADGTMVVLGVDAGEVKATPLDLVGGGRRLMGSPSGSRQDIRATLTFSAAHHVVPRITKSPGKTKKVGSAVCVVILSEGSEPPTATRVEGPAMLVRFRSIG